MRFYAVQTNRSKLVYRKENRFYAVQNRSTYNKMERKKRNKKHHYLLYQTKHHSHQLIIIILILCHHTMTLSINRITHTEISHELIFTMFNSVRVHSN